MFKALFRVWGQGLHEGFSLWMLLVADCRQFVVLRSDVIEILLD